MGDYLKGGSRARCEEIRVTCEGEHDNLLMLNKKAVSSETDHIEENIEYEEIRTSVPGRRLPCPI